MSRTLTIPDDLYEQLESAAHVRGLDSLEALLKKWQANEESLQRRAETVRQIDALRERLRKKYGQMPNSADLIREDRER